MNISKNNTFFMIVFFGLCTATSFVKSAAVASEVTPYRAPSCGLQRVWQSFSEKQKLIAHQAFLRTPLHKLPPGLVPLILDYMGSCPRFTLTADQIRNNPENDTMRRWLGNSPKPFMAIKLVPIDLLMYPALRLYWQAGPVDGDPSSDKKSFNLYMTDCETLNTQMYNPDSVMAVPAQASAHLLQFEAENEAENVVSTMGCATTTNVTLDVCIPDYDPEAQGGTRIEGCCYSSNGHEAFFGLKHASSAPMSHEDLEVLEAKEASEELKK